MSNIYFKAVNSMSTQAKNLHKAASELAEAMGHHVIDPSHIIVAVLQKPQDYTAASFPLTHPVHKVQGEYKQSSDRGLGLELEPSLDFVCGAFEVHLTSAVVYSYTDAMKRTLVRARQLADEEHARRDSHYGRVEITVFNLVWAAIETASEEGGDPLVRLIPDKQRAMHEFFRVNVDTESTVPTSVHAAVTGAVRTIRS